MDSALLQRIQDFYFEFPGYGSGAKRIIIPHLPAYKAITYRNGDLSVVDCWTSNGSYSAGMMTIYADDRPVWVEHYGGMYEEAAIPLLKYALEETRKTREFVGGRGPRRFSNSSMVYVNRPRSNDFTQFNGDEEIRSLVTGNLLGWHDYWGMALFS